MAEFDAIVLRVKESILILDQTCFFPQGGGQVGDTGEIAGLRVVDTCREGESVLHILLSEAPLHVGQRVHGRIDWERRYRIMRLHSAAHLVYYVMREVFGDGCRPASPGLVDDKKERSDYLFDSPIDRSKLATVEDKVNQLIAANLPITHMPERDGSDRLLWKIEPFEAVPCGGTHVRNTGEIGRVYVRRGSKPGRGKERIEVTLET
jgi:alanyl-tRNA synthetase